MPSVFLMRIAKKVLDFCQHFTGADGTAFGLESTLRNETQYVDNTTFNSSWNTSMFNGNRSASDYWTASTGTINLVYDLAAPLAIDRVNWVLYYGDTRTYLNVGLEGSTDGSTWTSIRTPANFQPSTLGSAGLDITVGATYRYLRFHGEGNTNSTGNDWVELEVYATHVGTNWFEQAGTWRTQSGAGKLTSLSAEPGSINLMRTINETTLNPSLSASLYNGNRTSGDWVGMGSGAISVTVDLGAAYVVNRVNWLLYYGDTRTYRGLALEGSTDNATWTTLRAAADLQPSTLGSTGLDITFTSTSYRYFRFSTTAGSTLNNNNEWVELEVYGAINVAPFGRTGTAFVRYPVATSGIDLAVNWTSLLSASRSVILSYDPVSDSGFAVDYNGGTTVTLVQYFGGASTTLGTGTVTSFSTAGWEILFSPSGNSILVTKDGTPVISASLGAATTTATDNFSSSIASPWTAIHTGTWSTVGGEAKCAGSGTGSGSAAFGMLVREQNSQIFDVQVDFTAMSTGSPSYTGTTGLIWNVVDGNNFFLWHSNYSSSSLYRVANGAVSAITSVSGNGVGTYRAVHSVDGTIRLYRNGTLANTTFSQPQFAGGTKAGIASNDTADVARFDNWTSTYPARPFGTWAGVASNTINADTWDEFCWSAAA